MEALADLTLWPSEKAFSLPAQDTPSMLFRFGGPDGVLVGARTSDPAGIRFAPGTDHKGVRLVFWASEAGSIVANGADFTVWYGGDIGSGKIREVAT